MFVRNMSVCVWVLCMYIIPISMYLFVSCFVLFSVLLFKMTVIIFSREWEMIEKIHNMGKVNKWSNKAIIHDDFKKTGLLGKAQRRHLNIHNSVRTRLIELLRVYRQWEIHKSHQQLQWNQSIADENVESEKCRLVQLHSLEQINSKYKRNVEALLPVRQLAAFDENKAISMLWKVKIQTLKCWTDCRDDCFHSILNVFQFGSPCPCNVLQNECQHLHGHAAWTLETNKTPSNI